MQLSNIEEFTGNLCMFIIEEYHVGLGTRIRIFTDNNTSKDVAAGQFAYHDYIHCGRVNLEVKLRIENLFHVIHNLE